MKSKFLRPLLITIGSLLVLGALGYWLSALAFFGPFDKRVTREETIEHFAKHGRDILNFSDLLRVKKPTQHELYLSLHGKHGTIILGSPRWSIDPCCPNQNFDFTTADDKAALLKAVGWDAATWQQIIESFRQTGCESAQTDEDKVSLSFKSGTWSSYSYNVNPVPIGDSLKKMYDSAGIQVLDNRVTIGRATAL